MSPSSPASHDSLNRVDLVCAAKCFHVLDAVDGIIYKKMKTKKKGWLAVKENVCQATLEQTDRTSIK